MFFRLKLLICHFLVFFSENKLLVALTKCEPEPLLALPDPSLTDDQYKIVTTLSDFYDRELVGTIGWAKQIPGTFGFPV